MGIKFYWARKHERGYEVSSKGDKRFSAFFARMPDGRTIEQHYQIDVKGYSSIQEGKGEPTLNGQTREELYQQYLKLWEVWADNNIELMRDLYRKCRKSNTTTLTDMFATSDVNQARALADVLNKLQSNPSL